MYPAGLYGRKHDGIGHGARDGLKRLVYQSDPVFALEALGREHLQTFGQKAGVHPSHHVAGDYAFVHHMRRVAKLGGVGAALKHPGLLAVDVGVTLLIGRHKALWRPHRKSKLTIGGVHGQAVYAWLRSHHILRQAHAYVSRDQARVGNQRRDASGRSGRAIQFVSQCARRLAHERTFKRALAFGQRALLNRPRAVSKRGERDQCRERQRQRPFRSE